ncbi:MAG TPA: DUF2226 domain-containing protein [Methanothermococcus okinawensis]|nr:DUF2226 domain-containing protein [Methanothermococcus okinawensis]
MTKITSNIADINLKDILKKLNRGCIYFVFTNKKDIDDVHIFIVKDGEIVSNVYTDGELWNIYGDIEIAYEILQDINKKVLLYIVEDEKIVGQLFISGDSIRIKGDTKEIDKVLNKNRVILVRCCNDIYLNTPYIKYIQSVDKNKVGDFESYLKEDKYYLVHINLSVLNINRNGYLVYKGREPLMAAYEDNYGILYGSIAYRKIKKLLERCISTLNIYEYREDYVKSLLNSYPGMRVLHEEKTVYRDSDDTATEEDMEESIFDINDIDIETVTVEEMLSGEDLTYSREELLKKLGLKDPDEEWVESILREYYAPSFDELLNLKKEIEKEIVKICSNMNGVKKVNVSLEIRWEDGTYYIEGDVTVETKKLFGLNLRSININPESIKRDIDNIIKRYIPTEYSLNISISIS